ncbi:RNA-binding RNA processing protein rpp1 [Diatrype stigma]|uniref:RNA-binding RNA processing protein rpp1 n=1 Tax=Diatrype stigma TaxID=117547 RepID=A0AAN9UHY2_9PEZI
MLYDLNIAWSPSTSAAELERTLKFSKTLGYDVVALNHTITPPIPSQVVNPLPKFPAPSNNDNKLLPTVLHRATLILSDPSAAHRLPQIAAAYDIVAVRPTSEREFASACLSTSAEAASLISLDLAQRFPFHFRPKPCMAAVHRGVRFEVCYAPCLSPGSGPGPGSGADARARAAFIGNVVELVRATRGRGLVLSSGARAALGLRAPADVVNLFAVWGLGSERGLEGLGVLPRGVVVNEGLRRSGFRGVVDIVGVAERDGTEGAAKETAKNNAANKNENKGNKNNKNKNKNNNNNQNKRKMGQESGGGGGGGLEGDDKLPNRGQAKKMKAAPQKGPAAEDDKTA